MKKASEQDHRLGSGASWPGHCDQKIGNLHCSVVVAEAKTDP